MKKWIGKKVTAVIMCVIVSLQMLPFVAMADSGSGTTATAVNLLEKSYPKDLFRSSNLSASIPDDKDLFKLSFDFSLVNDQLQAKMREAVKAVHPEFGDEEIDGVIAEWKDTDPIPEEYASKLPETGFTFQLSLADNTFRLPDGLLGTQKALKVQNDELKDEQVGTYSITQADASKPNLLTVTAILDPRIYKWKDVSASASIGFEITKTGEGTKNPVIKENGDKINVDVDFSGGGPKPDDGDKNYTIKKAASDITTADSSHFLTYTITAKAPADKTLNDMTIVDSIPKGLVVTKVEVESSTPATIDANVLPAEQAEAGKYFVDENGKLTYTIPDSPDVTELALTITTMLTSEKYQEYMKIVNGTPTLTFTNKAQLFGKDPSKPEAVSEQVTSTLSGSFMNKKGERVGLNSPEWKWTITANTYFTGKNGTVYLIDSIQGINQTHKYLLNSKNELEFTVNENEQVAGASSPSSPMTYAAILKAAENQTTLKNTLDFLSDLTDSGSKAVYYTNSSKNEAILIIPLAESELNKPLEVTYSTVAIASADGTYTDKNLQNEATMLWKGVEYDPGTGGTGGSGTELPSFSFNIKKEYAMDYSVLKKEAGNYQKSNREMTWSFKVNYSHLEIKNATITDVLHDDAQVFKSLSAVLKEKGESNKTITFTKDGTDSPSYTLTPDEESHTTLLTISLGDIEEDQVYEITLKTTVVDPLILNQNSDNAGKLTNKATITGDGLPSDKDYSSSAEKSVGNTILIKDNIGVATDGKYTDKETNYYDYTNHQLYWRVTVNPNHSSIAAGAILTDTVPTNTEFGQLLEVKQIAKNPDGSNGTVTTQTVNKVVPSDGSEETITIGSQTIKMKSDEFSTDTTPRQKVQFKFENTFDDTYVMVFSTVVKEDYRKEIAKELKEYSFTNDCSLTGEIVNPTGETNGTIDAIENATHKVRVPSIGKQGQYVYGKYKDDDSIYRVDWQILLNADGVDMEGATLTDHLKEWFQLDQESLSIKQVNPNSISSTGPITGPTSSLKKYVTGNELKDQFKDLKVSNSGFSFKVPKSYAHTPLLITFTTLVVGEVTSKDKMSNSASLAWSGGDSTETGEQQGNGAQTLTMDQIANASTSAQLRILKTSTNTTGSEESPDFRLSGAQFTLTQMKQEGGKWVADKDAEITKTTPSTGKIFFLYLNKNVLYQLEETQAPNGYQRDTAVRYYVFTENISPEGTYPEGTITKKAGTYTTPIVIKNKPKNNQGEGTYSFSFTKQSDDENPVQGAKFTLTGANLQVKEATSDQAGSVKFENVDPGTYELKESTVPNGFEKINGTVAITISTSGQLTMTGGDFLTHSDEMGYTVTNVRTRGTVTLQKQDTADSVPVSGAKFTVYSKIGDVPVAYLTESDITTGLYQLSGLETPAKNAVGDWYLSADNQLIVGDYYVKETTTPTGYLPDVDEKNKLHSYDFSIATQGQAVTVSNNGSVSDFFNTPIGSITGQKVIADSGLPLAGATIGLFNAAETNLVKDKAIATVLSENDGSFTFSNLLYGTYKIAEVAAPGRYLVNTSAVFTVTVNQNKEAVTMDDSGTPILIANTRRSGGGGGGGGGGGNPGGGSGEGYIVIQKTSEDGVLSGFTFEITDGNSYTQRFVTDADGRIMTGELPKGTYTIREIAEEGVTDKYELPKAQTVRISGVGTKINFVNKLRDEFIPPEEVPLGGGGTKPTEPVETIPDDDVPKGGGTFGPKTGFTGASPLWALLLGLSLAGLGYSVISLLVERRKGRYVGK